MHNGFLFAHKVEQAIDAGSYAAGTALGNAIDGRGFGHMGISALVGTVPGDIVIKVQESDAQGGPFTDITNAVFASTITTVGAHSGEISLRPFKPWIRVTADVTGAAADFAVAAVLSDPIQEPATTDAEVQLRLVNRA